MELLAFFDQFDSDKDVRPSIKEFIEHEKNLLNAWNKLISEHIENVKVRLNQRFDYEIPICDLRPFHSWNTRCPWFNAFISSLLDHLTINKKWIA